MIRTTYESRRSGFWLAMVCVAAAGILGGCTSGGDEPATVTSSTGGGGSGGGTPPPPPPPPPPGTGTATLSWQPPNSYTDGSPLTISGYRFYAGPSQNNLSLVEDLGQSGISSHMISGLSSGTWFFAVTVYDPQGLESQFSNIASKAL